MMKEQRFGLCLADEGTSDDKKLLFKTARFVSLLVQPGPVAWLDHGT
jgi:hypothetical protein